MSHQKLPSIWLQSSLTISHPTASISVDTTQRFQYGSIYHRDDPHRPKKQLDQLLFPHDLLLKFRKHIKEASKSPVRRYGSQQKKTISIQIDDQRIQHRKSRADMITKKLYACASPLAGNRDSYGNRASFDSGSVNQKCRLPLPQYYTRPLIQQKDKRYVTAAQRLDLSRPSNFNPGPGKYQAQTIVVQNASVLKRKARKGKFLETIQGQQYVRM